MTIKFEVESSHILADLPASTTGHGLPNSGLSIYCLHVVKHFAIEILGNKKLLFNLDFLRMLQIRVSAFHVLQGYQLLWIIGEF